MFLELPELCPLPFPRLESLEYEGSINSRVLDYLTSHAPSLVSVELRCGQSVLEPSCLRYKVNKTQYLGSNCLVKFGS